MQQYKDNPVLVVGGDSQHSDAPVILELLEYQSIHFIVVVGNAASSENMI